MTRMFTRKMVTMTAAAALALTFGCGDISENDFGQTLSFNGFFEGTPCSADDALVGIVASTSPPGEAEAANCTLGATCIVAVQVTNRATGSPIPTTGGQGATGRPVPSTQGLRILPKNIHIEYLLPVGELPARDLPQAGNINPNTSDCREFPILSPQDTVAMAHDPLSFPSKPFFLTARVTYEAVTAGGQDIRAVGDTFIEIR